MTLLSPSTESQPISPSRQLLGLSAVLMAVWLALAGPAVWYSGFRGLEWLSWAVGLSLVPGLLVVALQSAVPVLSTNPHAVMVASAIRMLFVLGGVLGLRALRPELQMIEFAVYLVLSYCAALGVESYYLFRLVKPVSEST
jgi:hypothetical protein